MKEGSCNPSLIINTEPPGLDCQIHRKGRSHLFTQKGTFFTILMSLPGLRGNGPALAGKLWKGWSFRAVREGGTAGVGPTSLHQRGHSVLYCCCGQGSAGPGLHSQGNSGKDGAFALCARGGYDRFQCSLRPDPTAAAAGRSLRGAVGPKGCWLIVCGRRRVMAVCGWWGSLGSAPRGHSCRVHLGAFSNESGHSLQGRLLQGRVVISMTRPCCRFYGDFGWR